MEGGLLVCWRGRVRSGVGTRGTNGRLDWVMREGGGGGKAYRDGVDVENGDFGGVVI